MANGTPDFRVRSASISPTAFADVIQRKRKIELQTEQAEEQRRKNRFNQLITAINTGADVVSTLVQKKEKQKEQQRVETLAQEVGKAFTPTASSSLFGTDIPIRPTPGQARQRDLAMALVRQDPDKAKDLITGQLGTQQRRAADTEIRTIEFANGTVQDVIVDKAQNKVFTLSGQEIPDEVLNKSARGFAPQIVEDIEGRKARVTRAGRASTIFGEARAPVTGKEKRIQFTPTERKSILTARKEIQSDEFVKKQGAILKEMDKITALVKANPKGAVGPIRTQVSKVVAGEVGRLTDEDIERNVPTGDLREKLKQSLKMIKDGQLTQVAVSRYQKLIGIMQNNMADSINETLNDVVEDVFTFQTTGASKDALRKTIGRGLLPFVDKFKTQDLSPEDEATQFFQGLK